MAIIPRWQTPISRWSLDGNANDLYGLYNGTAVDMTYSTDAKEKGLSGSFSSSPVGYVDLSGLSLSSYDNFTMSIWVKCTSSGEMYLTHERVNSPDYRTAIVLRNDSNIRILTYVNSTFYLVDSQVTIDRYVWNHIVVTFSGSATASVSVYLNGKIYNTGSLTRYPSYQAPTFYLGAYGPSTTSKLVGLMDDVRFYDTALTADEVMNLYKSYAIPIWQQPLHHWKLDGDANDSAGNINGTAVGTVVYSSSQKVFGSQAFTNSGGANYIDLGSFRPYSSYTSFTWSMWFKTSYSAANQALFGQYTLNSDYVKYMIYLLDGTYYSAGVVAVFCDDATTIKWYGTTTSAYADGNWHFVALTDDNGTAKLYIDGKLTNVTGSYTRFTMASDKCHIGYEDPSAPVKSFNGQIDDVRVYDVALSASDVRALYNSYFTEKASNFMSIL